MKIAIIGDFDPNQKLHLATNDAIEHAKQLVQSDVTSEWIPTDELQGKPDGFAEEYHGFFIAPGSPYNSMAGALSIIKYARESKVPTIGTCGGFQHMVIEFARNVLGIADAEHAEHDPYASKLVVNPLSCNLKGSSLEVQITNTHSKAFAAYQSNSVTEQYYCNFGLNPDYEELFVKNRFDIVGTDEQKGARIMELEHHPFFIGTLFVPQDNSTADKPHKLVTAFLLAVESHYNTRNETASKLSSQLQ